MAEVPGYVLERAVSAARPRSSARRSSPSMRVVRCGGGAAPLSLGRLASRVTRKRAVNGPALPGKLVTAATASYEGGMIPVSSIPHFDFVTIMSYDNVGPGWGQVGQEHSTYAMAQRDVATWQSRGLPKDKLVLGVPFYGYGFNGYASDYGFNDIVNQFGAAAALGVVGERDAVAVDGGAERVGDEVGGGLRGEGIEGELDEGNSVRALDHLALADAIPFFDQYFYDPALGVCP